MIVLWLYGSLFSHVPWLDAEELGWIFSACLLRFRLPLSLPCCVPWTCLVCMNRSFDLGLLIEFSSCSTAGDWRESEQWSRAIFPQTPSCWVAVEQCIPLLKVTDVGGSPLHTAAPDSPGDRFLPTATSLPYTLPILGSIILLLNSMNPVGVFHLFPAQGWQRLFLFCSLSFRLLLPSHSLIPSFISAWPFCQLNSFFTLRLYFSHFS